MIVQTLHADKLVLPKLPEKIQEVIVLIKVAKQY